MNNTENNYINFNNKNEEDKFWTYVNKLKEWNEEFKGKNKRKRNSFIRTYGCQMNEHDSERVAWILNLLGFNMIDNEEEADFILFNTCAIRENAELRVYGKIGSLKTIKANKPDYKIAIMGCMMQIDDIREEIEEKYKHVDLIFGTHNIHKIPELLYKNIKSKKTIVDIQEDNLDLIEYIDSSRGSKYKGYVNIIYGCNNFCTYCVVPYARGREISREPEYILEEIKEMVADGYKEITLLGQNVNSYGNDFDFDYSFTDLLYEINKIKGIERLNFMTSHPKDISDELIEAYGEIDTLNNYLHLPVQSGSDRILKLMNRNYSIDNYLEKINKIREVKPDIALSTDIIVGFPGETEEDFQKTIDLVKEVKYDFIFPFIYSKRPATRAESMENHLDYEIKHERFERLNAIVNDIMLEKNKKLLNKAVDVFVEGMSKSDDTRLTSRTDDMRLVHFEGNEDLIGEIVKVKITDIGTFSLRGEILGG